MTLALYYVQFQMFWLLLSSYVLFVFLGLNYADMNTGKTAQKCESIELRLDANTVELRLYFVAT